LAARRQVLEPAQPDVEVAARDGGVEAGERDLHEARRAAKLASDERGNLDVEADDARRVGRIGFDERRAAFGVAAPAELGRGGLCRRTRRKRRDEEKRQTDWWPLTRSSRYVYVA
jgi:hypothetical protein